MIDATKETIDIHGMKCRIRQQGSGGPVIFWGMFPHEENEFDHLWDCLQESMSENIQKQSYTLFSFEVSDWNRDFSPWRAPFAMREGFFEGKGSETLQWLLKYGVPFAKEQAKDEVSMYLAGYSLAGLFSLWAAYESDAFDGIACCSGSLWFEGWENYADKHTIPHSTDIYLSLGGKEEKTKNPVMATIGVKTKMQEKRLKEDKNVRRVLYEMNPGGHFADAGKRLAKGIRWLISQTSDRAIAKQ